LDAKHRLRQFVPVGLLMAVLSVSAVAIPAGAARTTSVQASPIRHVVVIYMENHSFDNVLGFWCRAHPRRCPDGGMPATVRLSNGAVISPTKTPDKVPVISHATTDQTTAIDGGRMDGWQKIRGCSASTGYKCVSGYKPSQVPNATALASAFAISDRTFSMQNSPSYFGHLYAVAASTDGFTGNNPPSGTTPGQGWGCDSGKQTTWGPSLQRVPTCVPDPALAGVAHGGAIAPTPVPYTPTIMDRLHSAGLAWRIYGSHCTSEAIQPNGTMLCKATDGGQYVWSTCPSFAECLYTRQDANLVPVSRFTTDASAGKLPSFSLVTMQDFSTSEHNGSLMTAGDNWLGSAVSAVENSPDWRSTAIFITWDDCGCFYDQVAPGVNPDGTPQGPRVPLIIVSPFARPRFTDTTPTTFAGILAFTEHTFGLAPLSVNDRRAYDFRGAFNFTQKPLSSIRMVHRRVPRERIDWAQARQAS